MNDVVIEKINGGIGRRKPSADMVSGFLANGVAVSGGVQLNTTYRLKGIQDAIALGITESYDESNEILVFEHLNEIFRVNPDADVYVRLCAQSVSYADMLDKTNTHAKDLLFNAEGAIKQIAVAYNPATAVVDFTATQAAITKAQELEDEEENQHRPVEVLLEGKGFDYTSPVDFRTLNSKNVSVMVGQSLSIANKDIGGDTPYSTYAAVGTLLGAVSKAKVNENIGWIEKFNVYGGSILSAGISGTSISLISNGNLETLNENGSIFFKTHTGKAGYYFNDSHTCTEITSDYAYIENNRTINKAARAIRAALLPKLNSPILVDEETGMLSPEVVKSFEVLGLKALELMVSANEVSFIDVFVDPEQDILSTSEFVEEFQVGPTGTARKIKGRLGFTNPF